MMDIIKNLLKVKSLMTIAVMAVFVTLALKGELDAALIASVITSVVTFYFTKKDGE